MMTVILASLAFLIAVPAHAAGHKPAAPIWRIVAKAPPKCAARVMFGDAYAPECRKIY